MHLGRRGRRRFDQELVASGGNREGVFEFNSAFWQLPATSACSFGSVVTASSNRPGPNRSLKRITP